MTSMRDYQVFLSDKRQQIIVLYLFISLMITNENKILFARFALDKTLTGMIKTLTNVT